MKNKIRLSPFLLFTVFLAILFLTGCSTYRMRTSASREVYQILKNKSQTITKQKINWNIKYHPQSAASIKNHPLTLKDTLILARENNRDYQTEKETVYLNALNLTYQRYLYSLHYNLGGSLAGAKASNGEKTLSGNLNLNLIKWLAQGAKITLGLTGNMFQYLTGSREKAYQSIINLNILQPLFNGAGRRIAQEDLTRAERGVVYEIRSFLRYQQSFSVAVAKKYFSLLEAKSSVGNYWDNYQFLKKIRERIEMLTQAGRIPFLQLGQARQDEFKAYLSWLKEKNAYQKQLNNFKIFLGLSPEANLSLEEKGLTGYLKKGMPQVKISPGKSLKLSLRKRLDLMTSADEVGDAERKVNFALNALKVKMNINLNAESETKSGDTPSFDFQNPSYQAGLNFKFPFNNIPGRNTYLEAIINLAKQKRALTLKKDDIKLEVINSYHNLQSFYQTYMVQKKSLELAESRVESTNLLFQAGRATTRDVLEAQESYLLAKNSLYQAMVNYLISYLNFLENTGSLKLNEKGVWKGGLYAKISGKTG